MMLLAGCSKAGDRPALWSEVVHLSLGEQLVTEGARVKQVGVELLKLAVVWVVMCWLSEPYHPLGCVSLTFLTYL
jgi:hypothetical protein